MYYAINLIRSVLNSQQEEPPATDGYWKHYQTGVVTPVYLTDSNIEDEQTWRRPSWFDVASEIKLPTGIMYIEFDGTSPGLANMPEATLLDLPSTIIYYNTGFLGNTTKLQTIILRNPTPATSADVSFGPNIGDMGAFDGLYVPSESLTAYQTTAPWSAFASFIKSL